MRPSLSFLLQAEHAQVSQPFLIREVLQALYHFCGPQLDSLQEIPDFLSLGSPELDTVLQMWPHQGRVAGEDHFLTC